MSIVEAIAMAESEGKTCISNAIYKMKVVIKDRRLYTILETCGCGVGLKMHYDYLTNDKWEISELTEREKDVFEKCVSSFEKNADVWNTSTF